MVSVVTITAATVFEVPIQIAMVTIVIIILVSMVSFTARIIELAVYYMM